MEQRQPLNSLLTPEIHQIWQCLHEISDPELPVLSITDLGMVRGVAPLKTAGWSRLPPPTPAAPQRSFSSMRFKPR